MNVRPLHWLLYLLGLGHRLSPIGLGRVVTHGDYVGDGPSLGWVTRRFLPTWIEHDRHYRLGVNRETADHIARMDCIRLGGSLARYHLAWWLASPMLRLAWRYRWGGWQDLPRWLWWSCLAAWAVLWCGGWAGLTWMVWGAVA